MKPIALFQHSPGAGAGYFLDFAKQYDLPVQVFSGFLGGPIPKSIQSYSALVSMGGPMSVNDRIDFIEDEARLMEEALALNIPILGHCLGSQLLARALGAEVTTNRPARWEIGWFPCMRSKPPIMNGPRRSRGHEVFHWHNENFSLPDGAERLSGNAHCPNQAFVHGPHLGMQFHVEITETMVRDWCKNNDAPQNWGHLPSVQSVDEMHQALEERVQRSHHMADILYLRWCRTFTAP